MSIAGARIAALAQGWSIETTPAAAARIERFADRLPAGTTVNVTFLPGSDIADTIAVCARLRGEGFEPVPHIAARSLESAAALERALAALAERAGVREVLVIAGGVDRPAGPYTESMQVLASGLLGKHGVRRVGVAGHPEGSPDIPEPEAARALAEKNAWARDSGMDAYIATQFCFDARAVAAWERRVRAAGNRLPVHVGVAGPATLKTLVKFARMSGVGPSMRVLTRQAANIAQLAMTREPDRLVAGLAEARARDPGSLLAKLHFYPFGGLARTAAWAGAVAEARVAAHPGGGFSIVEQVAEPAPLRAAS